MVKISSQISKINFLWRHHAINYSQNKVAPNYGSGCMWISDNWSGARLNSTANL